MPTYEITAPDGTKTRVTGPPAPDEDLIRAASGGQTAPPPPPPPPSDPTVTPAKEYTPDGREVVPGTVLSQRYDPATGKTATITFEGDADTPAPVSGLRSPASVRSAPQTTAASSPARTYFSAPPPQAPVSPAPPPPTDYFSGDFGAKNLLLTPPAAAPKLGPPAPPTTTPAPPQSDVDAYRQTWFGGDKPNARPAQVLDYMRHADKSQWAAMVSGFSNVGKAALFAQAQAERDANRANLSGLDAAAQKSVAGMDYNDASGTGSSFLTAPVLNAIHERFNRLTGAFQNKTPIEDAPAGSPLAFPALYDLAQGQKGVTPSVTRNVLGMTTPDSLALLAAAAPLGGAAPALGRAAGIGFGLSQLPEITRRAQAGDALGALTDTAFALGPEALHHAPAVLNRATPAVRDYFVNGRAAAQAMQPVKPGSYLSSDLFGLGGTAQIAGRKTAQLADLLGADGQPKPFTLNPNWDAVENGKTPQYSGVDPRTPRAQKVRPVTPPQLPAIDSGVGGAGRNGVLLASDKAPITAMFNKAQERGHSGVMLSVGSRQMAASNMDAAHNAVMETRHIVDNLKTATPGRVNRVIKDAGRRFNDRMEAEGGVARAKAGMRLDDLLPFLGDLSFKDRATFLKMFASRKNANDGLTPYWGDIVNALNDPALVGRRANNGVAIGTLEKGGRAMSAAEAGVPALKSYSHVGKGSFDGYLPDIINYRDLESATPKVDGRGRLNPLGFQNSLPEVRLPLSYYAKHFGVNPREISAQGVFNGIGDGQPITARPDRPGFGRPDVLPTADGGGRDGFAGGTANLPERGRGGGSGSRPGHVGEPADGGGQNPPIDTRPGGGTTGDVAGNGDNQSATRRTERADAALAQFPRRPAGNVRRPASTSGLPGDLETGAFNRDPSARRSDVSGQAATPEGSRQTTGAVSARQAEQPDLFGGEIPAQKAAPKPPTVQKIKPEDLDVLPGIQYKKNLTDTANAVTDQLKGQTEYQTEFGGRLSVFKSEEGKFYALDGHHRRELAQRAGRFTAPGPNGERIDVPRELDAQVFDAKDGWTPESARRFGIEANLRENKGVPIEAADALATDPIGIDATRAKLAKLPNTPLVRDTRGLVELDNRGRELVSNGKVNESVAAAIGKTLAGDPERQKIALQEATKSKGVKNYDDGVKLATNVLYEPAVPKQDGAQGGLFDGEGFDSGYVSTAGKQTELENAVRGILQRSASELLRPTTADLRVGERIDVANRQADAAQIADTRSKADALFNYDPQVRKALRDAATAVQSGKATDAEAAQLVQSVVQERGKLSVADIVKGAGTSGEKARPAPLPVRERGEKPTDSNVGKLSLVEATKPQTAQERLADLAAQAQAINPTSANPAPAEGALADLAKPEPAQPREIESVWGPDNPRPTMEQRRQALEASRAASGAQTQAPPVSAAPAPLEDGAPLTFRQRPAPAAPLAPPKKQSIFATALKNPIKSKPRADGSPTPSILDNIQSSRKLLLLSGPNTRHIKGNLTMQIATDLARPAAAGSDILRTAIARGLGGENTPLGRAIGTNRTTGGLSLGQFQRAVSYTVKRGLPEAWENFKTGHIKEGQFDDVTVRNNKVVEKPGSASALVSDALGDSMGYASENELWNAAMNGIGRGMSSGDHVFKAFTWKRSIEEQATLIARAEKAADKTLPGDYVKTRAAELSKTPTEAMNTQAIIDAFTTTFANENGANDLVKKGRQMGGMMKTGIDLTLPFSKVPTNAIARTLEFSGLGMVTGPARAAGLVKADLANEAALTREQSTYKTRPTSEQAEKVHAAAQAVMEKNFTPAEQKSLAQAFGRGATGAGVIYLGYRLAENGYMTGKDVGKSDYKKREEAGEPEGALYNPLTKSWHVVSDSEPTGALLALGATIRERQGAGIPPVQGVASTVLGQINEIPALSASDQIKDLADIKNIGKFGGSTAASFLTPALLANVAAQTDPMKRKTGADKDAGPIKGFGEQLIRPTLAHVPGLRETLPETGPRMASPFDPFKTQTAPSLGDPDLFRQRADTQYTTPRRKHSDLFGDDKEKGDDGGGGGDSLFGKRRGKRKSMFSD